MYIIIGHAIAGVLLRRPLPVGANDLLLPTALNSLDYVARPAWFEHATLCLEAMQYKTLTAASGVAYEEARHLSRPWIGPNLDWKLGVNP